MSDELSMRIVSSSPLLLREFSKARVLNDRHRHNKPITNKARLVIVDVCVVQIVHSI
ncbi:hypothetical protein [Oleiphilus sp. HI0132]|uniref:hypothetical protein n=1 Tax=Oleiphilus sp. HI0132 TaxID=1822270 RepID=UPI0012E82C84|nr:hypothetical protein [Oleiphilus sp. HI0132]